MAADSGVPTHQSSRSRQPGPGVAQVGGPYPRFLTNRVFFLLCAANLDPAQVAKHRSDNHLVGTANLVISIPATPTS